MSWSPSGWPQIATAPTGTGILAVGCSGPFHAIRVGIPNAGVLPFTIAKVAARASESWSDYVNPTGESDWRPLTFAGRGAPLDEIVSDPSAPFEITAWPSPELALPGNGISPRWTWTDWAPVRSVGADPATGMHVLMLRWLNAKADQQFTYANGSFLYGWTGASDVNNGCDYAMGGYNNGSDYVTRPTLGDMSWDLCRQNSLLNGTPLAVVQFLTDQAGIVGVVAGDSHQSGAGTESSFNNFLAQATTKLARKYLGTHPVGYVNAAVGGIATTEIFSRLEALLPAIRPTFAVLPGWTYNEVDENGVHASPEANANFYSQLLRAAQTCKDNGVEPIFLTPFPRDSASMTPDVLQSWRQARETILRLRSEGAIVVDGGADLSATDGGDLTGTYRPSLSNDGVHPNDAGHSRVADELSRIIEIMMELPQTTRAAAAHSADTITESSDCIPKGASQAMKTLLFCTSYAESLSVWEERWGQWLRATTNSGVVFDKLLIVDDGSPVLPDWPGVEIVQAEDADRARGRLCIHHFADRRGQRVNGEPFPGWYRSFAHAVLYAVKEGYDRIIHIEGDAYLITDRAIEFFNSCDRGWVSLWCGRHRWPESTLQIINKDQFASCEAFFSKPYSAHLAASPEPIEVLLPLTSVNRSLIGDRYGEDGDTIPFGADYVSQVRWEQPSSYYWWLDDDGRRRGGAAARPPLDQLVQSFSANPDDEFRHNGIDYREFMRFVDTQLCPTAYLEIGSHDGDTLRAVTCDAICVDPGFGVAADTIGTRSRALFFQMQPSEFFCLNSPRDLIGEVDLAFLDGLHYFERALSDFINIERNSHPGSILLIHDCLPLNMRMTGREHKQGPETEDPNTRSFWTGDVWRILPILREFRPDLCVVALDCPPTGLILCSGLNSSSDILPSQFDSIVKKYMNLSLEEYGLQRLWRLFPRLEARKVLADPAVFCEKFRFRT